MMVSRIRGFITGTTSVVVGFAALIALSNLGNSVSVARMLAALDQRDALRAGFLRLDGRLLSGQVGSLDGLSVLEIPAQAAFNLAGLYDRLGPDTPLFIDKGQVSILRRLLPICFKSDINIDELLGWVAERSVRRAYIPVDGLMLDRVVDGVRPGLLWECLRFDPPIYRTQFLEASGAVLGAWFGLPLDVASSLNSDGVYRRSEDPLVLKASVMSDLKRLGGDTAEVREMGFAVSSRLRRYLLLDGEKVFATLLIATSDKGRKEIVSRRMFWGAPAVEEVTE